MTASNERRLWVTDALFNFVGAPSFRVEFAIPFAASVRSAMFKVREHSSVRACLGRADFPLIPLNIPELATGRAWTAAWNDEPKVRRQRAGFCHLIMQRDGGCAQIAGVAGRIGEPVISDSLLPFPLAPVRQEGARSRRCRTMSRPHQFEAMQTVPIDGNVRFFE
jgi:hypothetical protein